MDEDLRPATHQEDAPDEPDQLASEHRATSARVYDYLLGGRDNYPPDRLAAELIRQSAPCITAAASANRRFVAAAVARVARAGVHQFLDIGCGLPHTPNVHEIAQLIHEDARVAYVDNDPMALTHARALLATNDETRVFEGDARLPETIVGNEAVQAHLDWHQPVAVLVTAMLHHLDDAQAGLLIGTLRAVMAPGSVLVLTHLTADCDLPAEDLHLAVHRHTDLIGPAHLRSRVDLAAMLLDLELQDPGLVPLHRWADLELQQPDREQPQPLPVLAGIAQIPDRATTPRAGQP